MDVSIIVPAYNESRHIASCLTALLEFSPSGLSSEIIVIDNASEDNTSLIVHKFPVSLFRLEERVTVSEARNVGKERSKGKILVFVDADVIVTPKWSTALSSNFEELLSSNCISGTEYDLSTTPSWVERYWLTGNKTKKSYINGGNLIISRKAFLRLNGFDRNKVTGEDVDLCYRMEKLGGKIIDNPNFFVHHEGNPHDLLGFWRREVWHGIGDTYTLNTMLASKVFLASTLNALFLVFLICLFATDKTSGFFITFSAYFLFLSISVVSKYQVMGFVDYVGKLLLFFIYYSARFFSLFVKKGFVRRK
ncbi:glycosyltransferase [Aliagarivorans marinus]|uniref:glycosyltransferase n=1 Tax=Aliagarivorans marinus TaxID=561965 RepID=UPI0003F9DEFC|nr:glycosyltransferase [Aliagarivorans marinus]